MEDGKGKIFVGGLPQDCPQEMLTDYFGKFGAITDVVVMTDRNTGRCRGFGFVTFESEDSVEMVMAQHADHQILGKWVDCKRATKEGSKGVPPSKGGGGFGKGGGKFGGGMGMMGGYGGGYGGGKGGYGGGYGDGGGMKGAYGGGALWRLRRWIRWLRWRRRRRRRLWWWVWGGLWQGRWKGFRRLWKRLLPILIEVVKVTTMPGMEGASRTFASSTLVFSRLLPWIPPSCYDPQNFLLRLLGKA
eukprot:s2175_g1.t2